MKTQLLLAALLFSTPALAQKTPKAPTACGKHVQCGAWEGLGSSYNEKGEEESTYNESVEVSSTKENEVNLVLTVTGKTPAASVYNLKMEFGDEGRFTMTMNGRLYSQGVCKHMVCTYGMIPFKWPEHKEAVANAGYLIFKKDRTERHMLVTTPRGSFRQVSLMDKK